MPSVAQGGKVLLFQLDQTFLVHMDNELAMLQVGMPLLYCYHDCQVLFLVSREPLVPWAQTFAHERNRMAILLKYCPDALVTRVCFNHKGFVEIRQC